MNILFIGKRFYTNRDAFLERFGRIYQLPWHWSRGAHDVRLWLIDYHGRAAQARQDEALSLVSTPVRTLEVFGAYRSVRRRGRAAEHRPDVVVSSGDCYIGLMGYRLARRLGARFVFDVYDKYDEFGAYVRLPFFDPFHFLLRKADARLFASHALMERLGCVSAHDHFVPNGIDAERFHPMDMMASRQVLNLPADAVFMGYFGSMDEDRGIDDLLEAHRMLRDAGMDIQLLLGGVARPELDLCRPGVRYLGNLPHADVPRAMSCCNLLVLPYRRSTYLDMASSCKIAEYIATGRPLVATRTPNVLQNFAEQAQQLNGVLAAPGNSRDLAQMIRMQLEQKRWVSMPEGFDWGGIAERLATDLDFGRSERNTA